ncbi:MAG: hypothetical protein MN733_05210 [Nitrososphaera sp.]|nr:hypothetical protein [Nitrososphaera sp.]
MGRDHSDTRRVRGTIRVKMEVQYTNRNFEYVTSDTGFELQQSSAIGDYDDAFDRPGSSYLWYGPKGDREQFAREDIKAMLERGEIESSLAPHARVWLTTGSLSLTNTG